MTEKLSNRHKRFCDEYLIDMNGSRAYRAVYPNASDEAAKVSASKLLTKPNVKAYIDNKQIEIANKLDITAERVLKEYARLSFYNPKDFFDLNGAPIPVNELSDDAAAALSGLDVYVEKDAEGKELGVTKKIKLVSKIQPLDALSKHLNLFDRDSGGGSTLDKAADALKKIAEELPD